MKPVLGEGKIYGARYYTVDPGIRTWISDGRILPTWLEMEAWCIKTFGPHGGGIWGADPKKLPLPNDRWYMNNSKFWFRNKTDRMMFILRWA